MPQSTYSLSFDGINGKVNLMPAAFAGINGNVTLTLSFWFKASSTTASYPHMVGCGNVSGSQGFGVVQVPVAGGDKIVVFWIDNGGNHEVDFSAGAGLDNAWHNIIGVYNVAGSLLTAYLDGVSQGSVALSSSSSISPATDIIIGIRDAAYFTGSIDDVALFGSALSGGNITGLAGGSVDPSTLSPIGLWRLEEGSGTTTADSSGNGNTGTLTGGVTWSSDVPTPLTGGGGGGGVNTSPFWYARCYDLGGF